jgi:hypothetical protein
MDLTSNRSRARRGIAALAVAAALTTGGAALGGGVAAAEGDTLATRSEEPTTATLNPAVIRWVIAVNTCATIYPPGTDLTSCIANIY